MIFRVGYCMFSCVPTITVHSPRCQEGIIPMDNSYDILFSDFLWFSLIFSADFSSHFLNRPPKADRPPAALDQAASPWHNQILQLLRCWAWLGLVGAICLRFWAILHGFEVTVMVALSILGMAMLLFDAIWICQFLKSILREAVRVWKKEKE